MDARFSGYEFYHCYDYSIFLASNGDCLDRYVLRFNELVESSRMIYAIVYILSYLISFSLVSFYFSSFYSSSFMLNAFNIDSSNIRTND